MRGFADSCALVLAAGQSRRFEGDKLLHPLRGKPLAAHIADTIAALPFGCRIAVCPQDNAERAEIFASRGFQVVANPTQDEGLGHSLALGVAAAGGLEKPLLAVFLADMPFISAAHIETLLKAAEGGETIASETGGVRHPPAVFPANTFDILKSLQGDRGAQALLREARSVPCPPPMAADFDKRSDFMAIEAQDKEGRVGSPTGLR